MRGTTPGNDAPWKCKALIAAAGVLGSPCAVPADELPEIGGAWITGQDKRVRLEQSGSNVSLTFITGSACPNGGAREYFIEGRLQGEELRGTMMRCTRDPHLVEDCGLTSVYTVPVQARVSRDLISGTWRSEYYASGGTGECDYTRDPGGDADIPFQLLPAPSGESVADSTSGRFGADSAAPSAGDFTGAKGEASGNGPSGARPADADAGASSNGPGTFAQPMAGCLRFLEIEKWHGTFIADFHHRANRDPMGVYERVDASWSWTTHGGLFLEQTENIFVAEGGGNAEAAVDIDVIYGYEQFWYVTSNKGQGSIDLHGDTFPYRDSEIYRPSLIFSGDCRYNLKFGDITLAVEQTWFRTDTGERETAVGPASFDIWLQEEPLPDEGLVLSGRRIMPVQDVAAATEDIFVPRQGDALYLFDGTLLANPPPTGTLRWAVCPIDLSCPLGPAPEPETDRCSDPEPQRGLLEVEWLKRQRIVDTLRAEWTRLEEAKAGVDGNLEAWRAAASTCAIQQVVSTALSSAAGAYGAALGLIQKIASGDLSYLISSDELGLALDLLKAATSLSDGVTAADMRSYLDSCGALPADLEAAARRFVDSHEALGAAIPRVQEQVNRVRQQDLAYWNSWHDYYNACLDWAECEELDPERCEAPPNSPAEQLGNRPPPAG